MPHELTLNDGRLMPALGMGTYQIPDSQAAATVRAGLDLGFRLVDTAAIYHNERGVGDGMRDSEAWLTTKLWNDRQGDAAAALDESLALLGRDSVDLYLIHWPSPAQDRYIEAWHALIAARKAGKAGSIGVSNFRPQDLDRLAGESDVVPVLNQIELHPYFQQPESRAYHADHGIVTQSWSPLGQGDALKDETIAGIAARHGATPARVIIAWHLALGLSVIPKAGDHDHLADNAAATDLLLDDDDMAAIGALDRGEAGRIGPDPANF